MKPIDVNINRAQILSFSVELRDGKVPHVSAQVGLFSGETRISTFGLRTETWYSEGLKFELPSNMIEPIVDIAKQLEVILVRECNKQLKRLPSDIIENGS